MSDAISSMSKVDRLANGRERVLRCLAKCGGELRPVRHLDVQNAYLDEHGTALGKAITSRDPDLEIRKLFGKGKMHYVLQEYLSQDLDISIDTEQPGVIFLKLKKSLNETLASCYKAEIRQPEFKADIQR